MNIGQLIKLERQRQGMKQEVLASGICVPSYLSRIENGLVVPSEDIQQHLLKRLNIPLEELGTSLTIEQINQFKSSFKFVINSRDRARAEQLYLEIHSYIEAHPIDPNRLTLLLMETRLLLMLPPYLEDVQSNIAILTEFQKEMDTEQLFYLHNIQGILAYLNNHFREASEIFSRIFTLIKSYRMEDWEMAELYYISSLSLLSEARHILAIDYVKSALSYFNQEILVERSIECLIILGIALKNTSALEESVATYEKAREISYKIESPKFTAKIEHNLGVCYSLLKKHQQALFHFENSLKTSSNPTDQVIIILSIIKEYHKHSDYINAKVWLQKGLDLIDDLPGKNKIFYSHHFSIYKALILKEKNLIPTFKKVIEFFEGKQDYRHCNIYCNVLAKKLAEEKQYKQSTIFYEMGFKYQLKQMQITSWEELS